MGMTKEELRDLRNELKKLLNFIRVAERGKLPYFYRYFDAMKNNIEIFFCIGGEDTEDIIPVLKRDWKAAHTMLIGVQDYDPRENNPDADPELCLCFAQMISNIGKYFV